MHIVDSHFHLPSTLTGDDLKFLVDSGKLNGVWLLSLPKLAHWGLSGKNDDEVLRVSEKFPDFFVPFGFLDLTMPAETVDRLKGLGFAGLKTHMPLKPYSDESYFEHYARAEACGMPVVFHCGHFWQFPEGGLAVDGGYIPTWNTGLYHLDVIAKRFPRLTVIGAHLGWPFLAEAMALAMTHANVYFDFSGPLQLTISAVRAALLQHHVGHKLLFGTDLFLLKLPVQSVIDRIVFWRQYLDAVLGVELKDVATSLTEAGEKTVEMIMGGTAERILKERRTSPDLGRCENC